MTSPILVFGRSGQLARDLEALGTSRGRKLIFAGRETADLLHQSGAGLIERLRPSAVINAAAYTAVDKAESEPDLAFRLNRDAPGELARACQAHDVPFIHISTDYVFDGEKGAPYVETDTLNPLGVYGRSKAEGEDAVIDAGGKAAILRTSWVYGAFGANFVKTMLRLAASRPEIGVVADQIGRPTWSRDLAEGALTVAQSLIETDGACAGVYHLAGDGDATWADLAEAVFAESACRGGVSAVVKKIETRDYPTPVKRPRDSRLAVDKFQATFGWRPQAWRDALAACFTQMEISPP
jgi:dTDP-4-dehydrorhamnose reductase